jgi:hypothetical protein
MLGCSQGRFLLAPCAIPRSERRNIPAGAIGFAIAHPDSVKGGDSKKTLQPPNSFSKASRYGRLATPKVPSRD